MSSIRPLVTITILVVVGVFLFRKINEGPARLTPAAENALQSAPQVEVPPLASAPTDPTTLPPANEPTWDGGATAPVSGADHAAERARHGVESVGIAADPRATAACASGRAHR